MGAKSFVFAACAAATAALCAVPGHASADAARAWAAAKDNLPAQTALVVGADLTVITKTKIFNTLMPVLFAKEPDARKVFDTIKASCKIDPLSAIQGVVYATDAERNQGAVYLSLGAGLDQAKLASCFEQVAKANGAKDPKLTVKKTGAITEVTMDKDKAYVSWIGTDVLVIPSDVRDRAVLEKWIGQKGGLARSPVAKVYASANTKGAVWGASAIAKELESGVNMKTAYGALTLAGGNLVIDLHTTLDNAKVATDAVAKANAQIAQVAGSGQLPPGIQTVLKQVSVKSSGPDVVVKATVPESEVLNLLSMVGP
jgi:hypothetical protein